jgi:hypothetical protein
MVDLMLQEPRLIRRPVVQSAARSTSERTLKPWRNSGRLTRKLSTRPIPWFYCQEKTSRVK